MSIIKAGVLAAALLLSIISWLANSFSVQDYIDVVSSSQSRQGVILDEKSKYRCVLAETLASGERRSLALSIEQSAERALQQANLKIYIFRFDRLSLLDKARIRLFGLRQGELHTDRKLVEQFTSQMDLDLVFNSIQLC